MRALVTGASGLIGANLVRELLARGHEVRAFVRPTSNLQHLGDDRIEFVEGDILNAGSVRAAVRGCQWVFHAAAMYTYAREMADRIIEVGLEGTRIVIGEAGRAGAERVILTSSSVTAGYSDGPRARDERSAPGDLAGEAPYVAAKVRQERLANELAGETGIELVSACPTMSVGPFGNELGPSNGLVITYLEDPMSLTYPGGCNIVSVRDVAAGHVLLATHGVAGEKYLLGSENLEWRDVHRMIAELCGVPAPRIKASHTACLLAAAGEEIRAKLARRMPLTTRNQALMLGRYYWYDHSRAAALGYRPRPARTALAEAIAWLAAGPHVSRELRTRLTLGREVYEARRSLAAAG
jgi:dihydroflavonol-4-reductase